MCLVLINTPSPKSPKSVLQIFCKLLVCYQQAISFFPVAIQQMFIRMRAQVITIHL